MNTTKITKRSNTKQILKTTIITIIITMIKPSSSTDMHSYPPTPPPFKPNPNHTWYTPNLDNPWDFELNDDYNLDVPPTPEIPKLRRDQSIKTIINKMMANYKKEEPPSLDSATEVQLGIFVISFYSINEQTMDFSVSMYLRQQWTDPRLRLNVDADVVSLRLGDSRYQEIWVPDTFLRNEKAANFHQVTVDNRLLKLSPNGVLWYVTKITATLACPMNLLNFPMDTQECSMLFESFGYTYETMFFRTLNLSGTVTIEIAKDLQLPQFFIKNYTVINCDEDHNQTEGAFPCLNFRFILKRDIGYFLIQVYVPSILIVILSWVSFWIHADASPARVSIGLLTVLTTTTMSSGARATLPRVSYIKALDVWMIVCLLFVFLSLIEYAVVNVAARRTLKPAAPRPLPKPVRRLPPLPPFRRSTKAAIQPDEVSEEEERAGRDVGGRKFTSDLSCLHFCKGKKNQKTVKDGRYQARQFDKMARKIFPFSFLLFNIVYWTYYFVPAMWDD